MSDIERIIKEFIEHDEAGNIEEAAILAKKIREMQAQNNQAAHDFSAANMVKNIPSSAAQFGRNMIEPIINPVETIQSVGKLAGSAIDKGAETLANAVPDGLRDNVNQFNNYLADKGVPLDRLPESGPVEFEGSDTAEQVGRFFSDRYGSVNNLKKTIESDPVGSLADASAVLTGGASVLPQFGRVGNVASKVSQVGRAIDPVNLAKNTALATSAKMVPQNAPRNLYQSSAKFSTTAGLENRNRKINTALEEGIMPTSKGMGKMMGKIGELNDEIQALIDASSATGKTVHKAQVYKHLNELKRNLGGVRADAPRDLQRINKFVQEFDDHMRSINKERLTARDLQKLKTDAYKAIDFEKSIGKGNYAVNETRKAMAKGAKEGVEEMLPEVKPLNAREGRLLDLKDNLERSAARIENRDVLGIGAPIKISAGGMAGDGPGAVAGGLMALVDNPANKARLGIALHRLQKQGRLNTLIENALLPTLVQQGLFQGGRLNEEVLEKLATPQ